MSILVFRFTSKKFEIKILTFKMSKMLAFAVFTFSDRSKLSIPIKDIVRHAKSKEQKRKSFQFFLFRLVGSLFTK